MTPTLAITIAAGMLACWWSGRLTERLRPRGPRVPHLRSGQRYELEDGGAVCIVWRVDGSYGAKIGAGDYDRIGKNERQARRWLRKRGAVLVPEGRQARRWLRKRGAVLVPEEQP